jgi:hypothetical protein
MYRALQLSSAQDWPCFKTAAPHFKLCRFFISDSFCHSRILYKNEIARICESCDVQVSVQHWLCCPQRAADQDLLSREVGFTVDSFERLRDVLINPRHSVALEFVLSKFFKW